MNPVLRVFGRILSLVGISSPEDAAARKNAAPPAWKKTAGGQKPSHKAPDKQR